MTPLRSYQEEAIAALRGLMQAGHRRLILCSPTGSGKTEMAMWFVEAAARRGKRVAFLCDRLALVSQTAQRFRDNGIEHGVVQGHNTRYQGLPVQVCSVQTVERRGFPTEWDFIVVDEAHTLRQATLQFLRTWGGPTLGLTATPFAEGLADTYSGVVNARTTAQLLADGWLAPLKVYVAVPIDMTGAETKPGGEWRDKDVEKRGRTLVGDIVSEWQDKTRKHFGGPVKTLVFSATVAHGQQLCDAFGQAGHDFQLISYRDRDPAGRQARIEAFRQGRITGLVSCEALAKGFDVPDVLCGISARPYRKSFSAHVQQMGRLMRAAPGKDFGLWLDHTGNYLGFLNDMEDFFQHGVCSLKQAKPDKDRQRQARTPSSPVCPACGLVLRGKDGVCPACGAVRPQRGCDVAVAAGRMESVEGVQSKAAWKQDRHWVWQQLCRIATARRPDQPERARKFALAQFRALYNAWPTTHFHSDTRPADVRVERAVRYRLRKWYDQQRLRSNA